MEHWEIQPLDDDDDDDGNDNRNQQIRIDPSQLSKLAAFMVLNSGAGVSHSSSSSSRARKKTERFEPSWDNADDNDMGDDFDEGGDITDEEDEDEDDDEDDDEDCDSDDEPVAKGKKKRKTTSKGPATFKVVPDWPLVGRIDPAISAQGHRHGSEDSSSSSSSKADDAREALITEEGDIKRRMFNITTKGWPTPAAMTYNFVLDPDREVSTIAMDEIVARLNIFRPPVESTDGSGGSNLEWKDDFSQDDLRGLLSTIGKAEVFQRISLADLEGKLYKCRLCGWLTNDNEKKSGSGSGSDAATAEIFDDVGGGGGDDGKVEPYVYNNIQQFVSQSIARMNDIDTCISAAVYWLINAVIPSGGTSPLIRPKEIHDHFFGIPCVLDFRLRASVMLREIVIMQRKSMRSMRLANAANGSSKLDLTQAKIYFDSIKAMKEIYAVNPKNTMFHAPDLPIDTDLSNSLLGPSDIVKKSRKKSGGF
jgi:hypothetical protein